jgi:hypothetical protein
MKKETFLKKAVAGLGSAALVIALSACAHHDATADNGYGQIRTEDSAMSSSSSGTTVATVAAPANSAGVGTSSTPAVISGPVAVDSDGRAYTSSSAGSTGNSNTVGTNTNVNLVPKKTSSDVTVTQSAATIETPVVTETPAPVIAETPAPAPIVETPAPVLETPMASSTTETATTTTETTKHHRRMRKD